jgi:hypothetical protein
MRITHCGYCGQIIIAQNQLRDKKGNPHKAYRRRLRCGSYYHLAKSCMGGESCPVAPVENAIIAYCSDQMNLDRLLACHDTADPLTHTLISARKRMTSIEAKLAKIEKALLADDGDAPETFTKTARALEKEKREQHAHIIRLERELAVTQRAKLSTADAWAKLAKGVQDLDYDARMMARQLVMDTFQNIDIFMRGAHGEQKDVIRLRLTSKQGNVDEFDIDRVTGERIDSDRISVQNIEAARKPNRKPRVVPALV